MITKFPQLGQFPLRSDEDGTILTRGDLQERHGIGWPLRWTNERCSMVCVQVFGCDGLDISSIDSSSTRSLFPILDPYFRLKSLRSRVRWIELDLVLLSTDWVSAEV